MDDLLKEVRERIKRQSYSSNEDILRTFVSHVENGRTPPDWLLHFMADGAREFLKGGKPWQNGKGGAPRKPYGSNEIKSYLLHYYGKLSAEQVARVLGELDGDGRDRAQTLRRRIKRGEMAYLLYRLTRPAEVVASFQELLELELEGLTLDQRSKCLEGLREELASIGRDGQDRLKA